MRLYKLIIKTLVFTILLIIKAQTLTAQLSEVHYLPPLYARTYVGNHYLYVTTPSATTVDVMVRDAAGNLLGSTTVDNSGSARIDLGNGYAANGVIDADQLNQVIGADEGLIVEATAPIYAQIRHVHSIHALALNSKGDIGKGTRFRAGTAYSTVSTTDRADFISVMATEDNTNVRFSDFTQGINLVGVGLATVVNTTLNAGESYTIASHPNFLNNLLMNGTLVTADKPILTNVGSWVNGAGGFFQTRRDISAEQTIPANQIGTEYILMGINGDPDIERVIIVADSDDTDIFSDDGNLLATIDAGSYYILPAQAYSANANLYIRTSQPAYVYQTTGEEDYNGGLTVVSPLDCWGVESVLIPTMEDHFNMDVGVVNIAAKVGTNITINGAAINNANPVLGKPDWVTYQWEPNTTTDIAINADDYIQVGTILRSDARGATTYYSDYIVKDTTILVELCDGGDYTVGNMTYTESGIYRDTFQSFAGCDSIVILDLVIGETVITELNENICGEASYMVGTQVFTETGFYEETLMSYTGCDSIVRLDLTVNAAYKDTLFQDLCKGDTYDGVVFQNSTTIVNDFQTLAGCDSSVVTIITVEDIYEESQTIVICAGESYAIGNSVYDSEGIYKDILNSVNGCDSTVQTNLIIQTPILDAQTITLCQGELYNGVSYTRDTTLTESLSTIYGCDSTVIRNIRFDSVKETEIEVLLCPGQEYNGVPYFADDIVVTPLQGTQGCDSIVTAMIMMESFMSLDTIVLEEGAMYNGVTYTENELLTQNLQTAEGCDSLAQTQIIINDIITGSQLVRLCDGEEFEGTTYEMDTSFVKNLVGSTGVDSIINIIIEVYPTYQDTIGRRICIGDAVIIGGSIQTESGFYSDNYTIAQGCDSVVVTALSVVTDFKDSINVILCDGAAYNGQVYEENTVVTTLFETQEGCDSTVISNIQIVDNFLTQDTIFLPEGDEYEGVVYTEDILLSDNLQTSFGCDSLVEIQIFIIPAVSTVDSISICAGDTYLGTPYFTDDIAVQNLISSSGGDSVHTTVVFVDESPFNNFGFTTCFGDSLFAGGAFQMTTGLYTDIFQAANGCDSTVLTNFIVAEEISIDKDTVLCQGDMIDDILIMNDTFLSNPLISINGCDSVIYTEVFTWNTYLTEEQITVPAGTLFNGVLILNDTLIDNQLTSINGCDSIIQTQITVIPSLITYDTLFLCQGENYNNILLETDTLLIDTLMTTAGLDSILVTKINVIPYELEYSNAFVCEGDSIFLAQAYQTESGIYYDTLVAQSGCAIIAETQLEVANQVISIVNESICEGDSLALGDIYYKEAGQYSTTLTATGGCDSVVMLTLEIEMPENIDIEGLQPYCDGEDVVLGFTTGFDTYEWSTGSNNPTLHVTEMGTYSVTITNGDDCPKEGLIEVPAPIQLTPSLAAIQPNCDENLGGTIVVDSVQGGDPIYEYALDDGIFQLENIFSNLEAGDYTVQIQDANGCLVEEMITINESNSIALELDAQTELVLGESTNINVLTNAIADSITWNPTLYLSCGDCLNPEASPVESTLYTLTIIDENGCEVEAEIFLRVDKTAQVYVPSGFSPNFDGINDYFMVYGGANVVEIKTLQIFDRWGNEIFQNQNFAPNEETEGWDGTYRGKELDPNVFVYYIEIELIDGSIFTQKGDLTILR